ncbi:MAG: Uma2 family endonuclease [Gemmatimonadetes bacterium]|nr:Uma2 family endonuclease [Gemmatimonadota bacterium]
MALQTVATMTADELLVMPHNGYRYELIKGELRQMAPAGSQHGRIAATIGIRLGLFVEDNDLGTTYAAETGFIIDTTPDTVRAPDASFVSKERAEVIGDDEGFFPGAPDLAVEVVSPNDRASEVTEKAFDWLRAGAKMVIVLDPKTRTATVYRDLDDVRILTEGDTIDGGDVLSGWQLPLADVF